MNLIVFERERRLLSAIVFLIGSANRKCLFMSHNPPRKTSLTSLVHSTLGLSLVPGQEGEAPPPHPQPGLRPQQGPEKKVENRTPGSETAAMHPGRLHFQSKSGAGSISSDKEASHYIPQKQDSSRSLGPADVQQPYESQVSAISEDGYVIILEDHISVPD